MVLRDNGRGISKDRESAIVRLGEHAPMSGTKLGRFGVGISYNACSAGNLLEVDSESADGCMSLLVDWSQIIRSGRWRIPRLRGGRDWPLAGPAPPSTSVGWIWDQPKPKDVMAASAYLAQTFYPAIADHAIITLNGVPGATPAGAGLVGRRRSDGATPPTAKVRMSAAAS